MARKTKGKENDTTKEAYEYGVRAFTKGIVCAPALDGEFISKFIVGNKVGEGVPATKAWLKGWTTANLRNE